MVAPALALAGLALLSVATERTAASRDFAAELRTLYEVCALCTALAAARATAARSTPGTIVLRIECSPAQSRSAKAPSAVAVLSSRVDPAELQSR